MEKAKEPNKIKRMFFQAKGLSANIKLKMTRGSAQRQKEMINHFFNEMALSIVFLLK